eukprot:Lankesteria_metandrocarpae@DN4642_c0_g1_i2.p1
MNPDVAGDSHQANENNKSSRVQAAAAAAERGFSLPFNFNTQNTPPNNNNTTTHNSAIYISESATASFGKVNLGSHPAATKDYAATTTAAAAASHGATTSANARQQQSNVTPSATSVGGATASIHSIPTYPPPVKRRTDPIQSEKLDIVNFAAAIASEPAITPQRKQKLVTKKILSNSAAALAEQVPAQVDVQNSSNGYITKKSTLTSDPVVRTPPTTADDTPPNAMTQRRPVPTTHPMDQPTPTAYRNYRTKDKSRAARTGTLSRSGTIANVGGIPIPPPSFRDTSNVPVDWEGTGIERPHGMAPLQDSGSILSSRSAESLNLDGSVSSVVEELPADGRLVDGRGRVKFLGSGGSSGGGESDGGDSACYDGGSKFDDAELLAAFRSSREKRLRIQRKRTIMVMIFSRVILIMYVTLLLVAAAYSDVQHRSSAKRTAVAFMAVAMYIVNFFLLWALLYFFVYRATVLRLNILGWGSWSNKKVQHKVPNKSPITTTTGAAADGLNGGPDFPVSIPATMRSAADITTPPNEEIGNIADAAVESFSFMIPRIVSEGASALPRPVSSPVIRRPAGFSPHNSRLYGQQRSALWGATNGFNYNDPTHTGTLEGRRLISSAEFSMGSEMQDHDQRVAGLRMRQLSSEAHFPNRVAHTSEIDLGRANTIQVPDNFVQLTWSANKKRLLLRGAHALSSAHLQNVNEEDALQSMRHVAPMSGPAVLFGDTAARGRMFTSPALVVDNTTRYSSGGPGEQETKVQIDIPSAAHAVPARGVDSSCPYCGADTNPSTRGSRHRCQNAACVGHTSRFSLDDLLAIRHLARTRRSEQPHPHKANRCLQNTIYGLSLFGGRDLERLTSHIVNSPQMQLGTILRNISWCCVYLWATTMIHRESPYDRWDLSHLTDAFYTVESVFGWLISFDYVFALLAAKYKLEFVFRLNSIIDVITMPIFEVLINLAVSQNARNYALFTGFLRFLRLTRISDCLNRAFPWLSPVTRRIIAFVTSATVIIFFFATAIYILEAPDTVNDFVNVFDFVYFTIVTVATVGYGDFAPTKWSSRALTSLAIITTFVFLPSQINQLITALHEPAKQLGRFPRIGDDYICILGSILPSQLVHVSREMALSMPGCCDKLVVITNVPIDCYRKAVRAAAEFGNIRVCIKYTETLLLKASNAIAQDSRVYTNARALFIVGNLRPFNVKLGFWQEVETLEAEQDQKSILDFIATQALCWPHVPICVQLAQPLNRDILIEIGAYHVVCLQQLKLKMMGKTCMNCPGFVTLMANWFSRPSYSASHTRYKGHGCRSGGSGTSSPRAESSSHSDMLLYSESARYQLFRLEFPECFHGMPYFLLTIFLYRSYSVLILGVVSITREYWLNPANYCIRDELLNGGTWPHDGVVLAPSLDVVEEISSMTSLQLPSCVTDLLTKYQFSNLETKSLWVPSASNVAPVPVPIDDNTKILQQQRQWSPTEASQISRQNSNRTFGGMTNTMPNPDACVNSAVGAPMELSRAAGGIKRVCSYEQATKSVFFDKKRDLILVCGWPRGLKFFLKVCLASGDANFIVLAPNYPLNMTTDELAPYLGVCAWVCGSALDSTDLIRCGCLLAKSCVVFGTSHVPWRGDLTTAKIDGQAILVRQTLYAIYNSAALMQKRESYLSYNRRRDQSDEVAFYDNLNTPVPSPDTMATPAVPILLELKELASLRNLWIDPERQSNKIAIADTVFWLKDESRIHSRLNEVEELWHDLSTHVQSPEFCSGRVYLDEFFHGLLALSLPVSRFAVDSSLIDHVTQGDELTMPLPSAAPVQDSNRVSEQTSKISMIKMPPQYDESDFEDLLVAVLCRRQLLVVGVYRKLINDQNTFSPLSLLQGETSNHVVISCPPRHMKMRKTDQLYVIASSRHELMW